MRIEAEFLELPIPFGVGSGHRRANGHPIWDALPYSDQVQVGWLAEGPSGR